MNTAIESANEYHAQADAFLARFGLKCRITLSNSKVAPWSDDGEHNHYRVTLSRPWIVTKIAGSTHAGKPTRLVFDWWDGITQTREGRKPHAHDVLACISGEGSCPETFAEFCAEYGYDSDSIKAKQTFRRAHAFAKRLHAFFTAEELEALAEIR